MTISKVAEIAGVSASTVSRVLNAHPSVTEDTAAMVRQAMADLQFKPSSRVGSGRKGNSISRNYSFALFMFGSSGSQPAPGFERLLRGVSASCELRGIALSFSYVSDLSKVPEIYASRKINGLLLHGAKPADSVVAKLKDTPTVWLMANRQRASWGDQVMPDNTGIGDIAARYLVSRGHTRLAYMGMTGSSWSFGFRLLSFQQISTDLNTSVTPYFVPGSSSRDYWAQDPSDAGRALVKQLMDTNPRPTGIFIGEDRLVPPVYNALQQAGLKVGVGKDIEIITCNNDSAYLLGLSPLPANIDIRTESIGSRGVEQLLWRINNPGRAERARVMVEPFLVQPGEKPALTSKTLN